MGRIEYKTGQNKVKFRVKNLGRSEYIIERIEYNTGYSRQEYCPIKFIKTIQGLVQYWVEQSTLLGRKNNNVDCLVYQSMLLDKVEYNTGYSIIVGSRKYKLPNQSAIQGRKDYILGRIRNNTG